MVTAEPAVELDGLGVRFGGRPILSNLHASVTGRAIGRRPRDRRAF